ncbi:hypothetical protein KVT40_006611 [Elsinoe batatas]|uniref:Uncharacterized protein n=1 Tax=Elsinoe batatas TaxID=2601811 RepID=A0A8K0KZL6_9PEZI|nr:hypothetical protein KVT40_006611 [Elsinoe batatas]
MADNQRYERLLEEQEVNHRLQMQEQIRSKGEIVKDLVTLLKRLSPQLRATRPETIQSEVVYDDLDKSLEEIERRINAAMEYEADQDDESTEDCGTPHGGRTYQLEHEGGSHRGFHEITKDDRRAESKKQRKGKERGGKYKRSARPIRDDDEDNKNKSDPTMD